MVSNWKTSNFNEGILLVYTLSVAVGGVHSILRIGINKDFSLFLSSKIFGALDHKSHSTVIVGEPVVGYILYIFIFYLCVTLLDDCFLFYNIFYLCVTLFDDCHILLH